MMLRTNIKKMAVGAAICMTALIITSPSVFAAEPHEDPEIAKLVFSGISLLRYYSESLDFVLQKHPAEVEARLEKMPFANIPQSLEESTSLFAASGISISHLVVEIDEDLGKLGELTRQSRLEEATGLATKTFVRISQANGELRRIEQAVGITGKELKVFSVPEGSMLRQSYDEVLDRINRIREMLALYSDLLADILPGSEKIEELLKLADIHLEELLESTEITLVRTPKPTDITLEELLKSADITLVKTLEPRGTMLVALLKSAGITLEELLKSADITIVEELVPTDVFLAELLKSADITLVRKLFPADITPAELLNVADFILVEALEPAAINLIELLKSLDIQLEELLGATDFTRVEALEPTEISLEVQPSVAFVGDNILFKGALTSAGRPLAGREVDILLNGSRNASARTDANGHYQGSLPVPYWYIPELDMQALYSPRNDDIGVYLAALSPVVKLRVLFYKAELEITVEDKAYPGRETAVTGRFDYGQSPPLSERKVEIYFDDVLVTEFVAGGAFAQKIAVDSRVDIGPHVITVSAVPAGRYSPVVANAILKVARASPILSLDIPAVVMIPGRVRLGGKLYSEVGPLSGATITMELGKSQVELVSSGDGTFDTKIGMGMSLGLVGSQDLIIGVLPQEPWHAPLNVTSSVLAVNIVNSGAFVAILLFLGLYLPDRLRRRLGAYTRRVRPERPMAPSEAAPAYSERVTALTVTGESQEITGEPRVRIFYWYRLAVRLLRGVTKALLGPQQTLREFARESSRVIGPAAKYFIELTRVVERLLYSQYRPTEGDVENSQRLSGKIIDDLRGKGSKLVSKEEPEVEGV